MLQAFRNRAALQKHKSDEGILSSAGTQVWYYNNLSDSVLMSDPFGALKDVDRDKDELRKLHMLHGKFLKMHVTWSEIWQQNKGHF